MGLLSKIGGVIKTAVTQPVASFKAGAAAVTAVLANPVTAVTKGYNAAYQKAVASTPTQNIVKATTTASIAAAAVIGGSAVASAAAAGRAGVVLTSAAKAVIPASTKGKVVAAVAVPVAVGVVSKSPEKAAQAVIETPAALVNVGQNIGNIISNPSKESVKELISENPVLVGGALAVGAVVAGKAIVPAATGLLQREAIKEQTEAIKDLKTNEFTPTAPPVIAQPVAKTSEEKPVVAETQNIATAGTSTTRKRRKKAKTPTPSIKQSVNVLVNDYNGQPKKFIKRRVQVSV